MNKNRDKDKIKILRVIARMNMGGPAKHVILLNSGLNDKKFSSYLATGMVAEGERDMTAEAKDAGIEPVVIPELNREITFNSDFVAFFKLFKLMREIKPDIVHTHTAKAGTLGRIAAILNRVPIKIHTFHGHTFHSYFGRLRTKFFMLVEKILAKFTNRIVVISQSQLDDVKDTYRITRDNKCSVIPLGLDLEPLLRQDKKDTAEKDILSVGIIGRLADVKNHKMFLDVVKMIKHEAPDIKLKFKIIGDGVLRNELESYARELNIEDSVVFAGWRTDLESIYRNLDIVCLTSLNEGTPISLIEAMAAGRPVVSTDVGGVRDIISHNETGLLSPSGDVEKFSRNLLELLRDKNKRDRMGKKGREFVSERFSKTRLIKDIEMLYEEEIEKAYGAKA